ncbi:hypothetical protein Hanom_Chr05g00440071 [Helianthus anomalus]
MLYLYSHSLINHSPLYSYYSPLFFFYTNPVYKPIFSFLKTSYFSTYFKNIEVSIFDNHSFSQNAFSPRSSC